MKLYTTKIVAQYLDLSERRVRQLRDEGVLEEKAPGLYDLRSSVRRYINYLRGDEGGKADLNEERAKLTKEKRIAAETENKVRNGELYRKSDITVGMTTVVMNLRSRLLALPNKLAANIAKLDGDEGKIIIVGEIRQQLTQYDGVVFMGTLNFGGFMLNVFSVDETYEDETGKSARYFPATAAMVTAPDCGHMMYGSITQMDYGKTDYTTYAAKRVAKLVVDQDKDTRKLRLGCRPLAAPKTYCPYIYAADVVG